MVAMLLETPSINESMQLSFNNKNIKKIPVFNETTIENMFDSTKNLFISEEILANFRAENYTVKTMFTKVFFRHIFMQLHYKDYKNNFILFRFIDI